MHLIKTAVLTEKPKELLPTFFSNYLAFVNNYSVFVRNDAFILDTLRPEVLFVCLPAKTTASKSTISVR